VNPNNDDEVLAVTPTMVFQYLVDESMENLQHLPGAMLRETYLFHPSEVA
jgi:hypothetical protein